jgi:signal transduction histidine kinase
MSGIELAHIIKQRKRTQYVPILFLTAYLLEETDILRGYGAGAVDYLSKPINPEILRSKVAVFVELHRKSQALASANVDLENEITERKRAQDELRQVNEALEARVEERTAEMRRQTLALEQQNRLLDEFAHLVSHDLKAPLRGICHVAEWLRADHRDALGAVGRSHLDLLVERSQKMNALIQGLLERARAGQETGRDEAFDAGQAVATVIAMLSPPPHITISTRPLPQICYDRLHFERILQNLIGNAIQHMGRPVGHVSVEVDEVPEAWRFAVRDNGIGIADQDQPRVFDMFVAGKPPDKNGTSGVGLAIVRSIVERHGGRVWLESKPGRGSCFFFTVPRTASTQS